MFKNSCFSFQIKSENRTLQAKIKELEEKLADAEVKARLGVDSVTIEKDLRIEALETELAKIQANEDTLNDTIEELREVENALRSQVLQHFRESCC